MSKPFYFITCQWESIGDSPADPDEITTSTTSLWEARRMKNKFQRESDRAIDPGTPRELFRIFKVQEMK